VNRMTQIQLLLLDGHAHFRPMLDRLLDTDSNFHVAAHCSSMVEALEVLARARVDLVLLDYDLGKTEAFQFIQRARDLGYTGRIFIVTAGMTGIDYVGALGHGVCGIIFRRRSPGLLAEAIHKVMAGETWIDPYCIQILVQAVEKRGGRGSGNELTEREHQVLKGIVGGLNNKEIGSYLNISEASVKSALRRIFLKTGIRKRSQLVRAALEEYGTAATIR
jgi:two-component system, NarL family, nitrate/nitrite response regulator NarL